MKNYRISEQLLLQAVNEEMVILDPDSGRYFTLNEVGSEMLGRFRQSGDIDDTVAHIAAGYEVSEDTARRDLLALLDELVTHGLAEAVEA